MTDKVQEIREEVARKLDVMQYQVHRKDAYKELKSILDYIDSLQEEPVSGIDNGDMPVERWKQAVKAASNQRNYRSSKGLTETRDDYFVDGVQWADEHPKKEPVCEELEEAARSYSDNLDNICGSIGEQVRNSFKAGAEWQKQQMMVKAIDGKVIANGMGNPCY